MIISDSLRASRSLAIHHHQDDLNWLLDIIVRNLPRENLTGNASAGASSRLHGHHTPVTLCCQMSKHQLLYWGNLWKYRFGYPVLRTALGLPIEYFRKAWMKSLKRQGIQILCQRAQSLKDTQCHRPSLERWTRRSLASHIGRDCFDKPHSSLRVRLGWNALRKQYGQQFQYLHSERTDNNEDHLQYRKATQHQMCPNQPLNSRT